MYVYTPTHILTHVNPLIEPHMLILKPFQGCPDHHLSLQMQQFERHGCSGCMECGFGTAKWVFNVWHCLSV